MRKPNEIEYIHLISKVKIGKHLPDAIYMHESALAALPQRLIQIVEFGAELWNITDEDWNIIKFFKRHFQISLLNYPTFFSESYPALQTSIVMNFNTGKRSVRNFSNSSNPPILHRKEYFLLPSHPCIQEFKSITKEGEDAGLYTNSKTIGFKQNWNKMIEQKGLILINGRLVPRDK